MIDELARDAIALARGTTRAVLGITVDSRDERLHQCCLEPDLQGVGWVAHIPMDGFHLADSQLRRLGALDRKGAPDTFDAVGYAHLIARVRAETEHPVYAPGFERTLEQPLATALVVLPKAQLVITEGNYLLLDDPAWAAARAAMDTVWFVSAEETTRIERLVARHVEFGKKPDAARVWVAETDQQNAELVSATRTRADRVIVNGAREWFVAHQALRTDLGAVGDSSSAETDTTT